MKKLLIGLALLCGSYFVQAQDTTTITLRLSLKQVNTIIDGLNELKLKDAMALYMSVMSQTQTQIIERSQPKPSTLPNDAPINPRIDPPPTQDKLKVQNTKK